jgi:hypothetical protein
VPPPGVVVGVPGVVVEVDSMLTLVVVAVVVGVTLIVTVAGGSGDPVGRREPRNANGCGATAMVYVNVSVPTNPGLGVYVRSPLPRRVAAPLAGLPTT